jgi:beta-galactosidase GanA
MSKGMTRPATSSVLRLLAALILAFVSAPALVAQTAPLPRIVSSGGKHQLLVDGEPFLMLAAQANNSSNYPAMLPKVWPVIKQLHANALEIPIAWEQVEPVEGRFDFSFLDQLLREARANDVRLVLLWFGTWKNTSPNYAPEWVRSDTRRFPRMRTPEGKTHYVLSPHGRATLDADKRAFVRLMRHLAAADPQNTVIMVQPQNELGSYGLMRDHAPEPKRLFQGQVPAELVRKLGKRPGTWTQVFGEFDEQAFTSWHMARYVDEMAAAGKAVKNLPMYCNAALGDPFDAKSARSSATGGPQWNMIDVWKAAAPNIDVVAPDIYNRDQKAFVAYLDHYARSDNALMIPELGNAPDYARFFWAALGKGAIGFAPFGMDATGYSNYPLGAKALDAATIEAFASKYRLFAPIHRHWARIAGTRPVWGAAKGADAADQSGKLGRWRVTAQFELWEFGEREWTWIKMDPHPTKGQPVGGMVVAQLGPDEFLLAGSDVRVRFGLDQPAAGENAMMLRVEEGSFAPDGSWVTSRVWNGDQTDYGLNFTGEPRLLKVKMGSYR